MNPGGEEGCHYLLGFLKTHPPICTLRQASETSARSAAWPHVPQFAFSHPSWTSHTDTATTKLSHQMECQTHYDAFSCLPTEGQGPASVLLLCVPPRAQHSSELVELWKRIGRPGLSPTLPLPHHVTSYTSLHQQGSLFPYHDCSFKWHEIDLKRVRSWSLLQCDKSGHDL